MRVINEQDVFDIIDDLRDRMTVEGYCAMAERVKALPSAQPEHSEGLYVDGYNDGYMDGMKDAQPNIEEDEDIPMEYFENGGI